MKPLIVSRLKLNTLRHKFDLEFKRNLTLIMGDSAVGKSYLYQSLKLDDSKYSDKYVFMNCWTPGQQVKATIHSSKLRGKIVVIDNAESILRLEDRCILSEDTKNQYIVMAHDVAGYMKGKDSITRLYLDGDVFRLNYFLL